jgi:nicotinic acid mononucleotide adenylyltransferase
MPKTPGRVTFKEEKKLVSRPYSRRASTTASASATESASVANVEPTVEDLSEFHPIIFTIARMNPPTLGHMKVVNALIEKALEFGQSTVYVLLQAGDKAGKETQNPLNCEEKKTYLEKMILSKNNSGVNVIVVCADDEKLLDYPNKRAPLNQIWHIYDLESENIKGEGKSPFFYLMVGTDRVSEFSKFIKPQYLPLESPSYVKDIPRPKTVVTGDPDQDAAAGISGTKLRELAKNGERDEFMRLELAAGLSPRTASKLYDDLHVRMRTLPPKYTKKGVKRRYNKTKRRTRRKINKKKR